MRVKITVFVPVKSAHAVRTALGSAGAGSIGEYSFCSFTTNGIGRFTPSKDANPHIGEIENPESVAEERIEVVCEREYARKAIRKMKDVHPYEEVAFDIVPLIEESEL